MTEVTESIKVVPVGEKLANGARVLKSAIANTGEIVYLALFTIPHPIVVWYANAEKPKHTYWGSYHDELDNAILIFNDRVNK